MKYKYILIHEDGGQAVYDTYNSVSEMCQYIKGLNKGIIYDEYQRFVCAFCETDVRLNRELDSIPSKLIQALY